MRQLKKLICLNLALLMLLSMFLSTVAFAEEPSLTGTVTLTLGGQTYTLSEYENASGNGWSANIFHSSNNERSWWGVRVSLRGDVGSISVDATGSNVEELEIKTLTASSVTAESGAAITASGFDYLTMLGTKALCVTGQPAVKLDEDMTFMLIHSDLTLQGTNGAAYEAKTPSTDDEKYTLTETKNDTGTVTKLECKHQTVTLTLHDENATKHDITTIVCDKNEYINLSNVFWHTYDCLAGWKNERGNESYTRGIIPSEDMELWADWGLMGGEKVIPAIFDTSPNVTVVEASEDGWTAPEIEDDTENHTYGVAWKAEIQPGGETVYVAEGGTNKALTRGLFFESVTSWQSHGILFVGNGRTIGGGNETIFYTEEPVTVHWTMDDGSVLTGWNTQPDGSGTSYAAYDAEVDGADTGWVILYPETLPKGSIQVNWWDNVTENSTTYAKAGDTLTMPTRTTTNAKVSYWSYYYRTASGYTWGKAKPGETFTIPEGATSLSLTANWIPTEPFTVNGTEYTVTDSNIYFTSTLLGMSASIIYSSYSNQFQVGVWGEDVKSMHFPVDTVLRYNASGTKVSGTISCDGALTVQCTCSDGTHPSLTIDGGSDPAIRAEKITISRAPHMTLTTTGTNVLEGTLNAGSAMIFKDANGKTLSLTEISGQKKLTTEVKEVTITIDGNGGTSKNGNTTETVTLEAGEQYRLKKLGFTKAKAYLGDESISSMVDKTLTLNWHEVGYDYIAFQASGWLEDTDLQKDYWEQSHYVFFADNSETVTVPDIVYRDRVSNGDLLYWYTENEDGSEHNQYVPGDTVMEANGTVLHAKSKHCSDCCYILHTNGKTVEGMKDEANTLLVSESCKALVSKDGKFVCESFNTKPDGTGTRYEIGSVATNPDETPVLYAQWAQKANAVVEKTEAPAAAETAPNGDKPTETAKNTTITISSVTVTPDAGSGEATEKPIEDSKTEEEVKNNFEEGRKVLVAAYQDGKMVTVLVGEAKDGKITCVIPWWLDYEKCQLKLFVVNGYQPETAPEIIKISETEA